MIRPVMVVALAAALAACGSEPVRAIQQLFQSSPGYASLRDGLRQYDDGAYADSAKSLNGALELGLNDPERANAHKYLAFIHCVSGRQRPCRDEFRAALKVNPSMELEPSETGHPIWGPAFRSAKARK